MPGLTLLRHYRRNDFEATLYEPVVCLIVQGRKETTLASRSMAVSAGDVLLISHDLPVLSHVTEAPYLSLLLKLELGALRSLYEEVAESGLDPTRARALEVHRADPQLIEALHRYLALAASATDAKVLGPLIVKEIHYRLLMAPFGGMLRSLVRYDSPASAVTRAIAHIRRDFRRPIAVPELAQRVGMSASAFHKHFKAVTCSTPLQYQKDLRLLEARRLLVTGGASVSTAAYEVGYESPSQFSREYARKFGAPPSHDLASASGQYVMQE
jgi:AraC-like DNA-binding protein